MNFPFFIAKRYLISKKSHNAINIISGISITGISIVTMALIIVLSVFNGLSQLVQTLYNSFDPTISITAKQGKTFDPNTTEFQSLKKLDGIAYYTEVLEGNALLKHQDKQCIATIKGVSKEFEQMSGFDTLIHEGSFNLKKNNIIIGNGIAYKLQTGPNVLSSPISIYAPKRGNTNSLNPEDGLNELKVYPAGTFTVNDEFDEKYALMNIENARTLFDYTNEVTSIELSLKSGSDPKLIQAEIEKTVGEKYEVKNREQQNALLFKTFKSEKLWTFIILIFILIIASFNVIGSLTMLIIEKKKDIIILHNMGADVSLIRKIFLVEGMLITFIGTSVGLIIGTFLCWLQMKYALIKLSDSFTVINAYPVQVQLIDVIAILAAVLLIGFFAAWYPVRIFTKKYLVL